MAIAKTFAVASVPMQRLTRNPRHPRFSGFLNVPCNLGPNFRLYTRERPEMTSHDEKSKKAKTVKKACQRLEFSIKTRIRGDKQKGD